MIYVAGIMALVHSGLLVALKGAVSKVDYRAGRWNQYVLVRAKQCVSIRYTKRLAEAFGKFIQYLTFSNLLDG